MQLLSAFAPLCKGGSTDNCGANELSGGSSQITRTVATIFAAGLVIASAGFGATYAWSTGSQHGTFLGALTVLFAVSLEGTKPLSLAAAFAAFRTWSVVRGLALLLLASIAVAYSLTAELSLMAQTRGDLVAQREQASGAAALIKDRYERAKNELSTLKASRPAAEVEALLDRAKRVAGCGAENGTGRWVCRVTRQQTELAAELARAKRRAELEATMHAAETDMASGHAVKAGDPAAHALVTYLGALGLTISSNVLTEWLVLIPVLALEVGSALAVILLQSTSGTVSNASKDRRSNTAIVDGGQMAVQSSVLAGVQGGPVRLLIADDPHERLLSMLRERGGMVFGGQRSFAKALGISAARVNKVLHELAAGGRVMLETGKSGTMVRLVTAAA